MMKNRIIAACLAVGTFFGILTACLPYASADENTIYIRTKDDFIEFASNCTLDAWSHGKTVNLTADIDFSENDFVPVPSFGGVFNGNGHTISGISYEKNGSYKGIFRYVEDCGKISDLNVEAKFILSGSKSFLGGIVGQNSGTIENCSFYGNLKGENVIGGIAGENTNSGRIVGCIAGGTVTGENSTGGIVGKNSGFIQSCTNNASVNTIYEEKKTDITDIETDTAALIENYKNSEEENREESVLGHTDTGGIAGFTSGILQGCQNNGDVGYKHIGYNVGGIAGRQSGYILGCRNYGFIQGRKDVGGIVGQAEPYIILNASESTLQELKSELDKLTSDINKLTADTDSLGSNTETYFNKISNYSKAAKENTQALINQGTDFTDDNLAQINSQAASLSNTIDKLSPVFDSLADSGEDFEAALSELSGALDELNLYAPELNDEINKISAAVSDITKADESVRKAAAKAQNALRYLEEAITFNRVSEVRKAVSNLSEAIKEIVSAKEALKTSVSEIEGIISSKPDGFENIGADAKKIIENLKSIAENTEKIITSLKNIDTAIGTIAANTEIDFSDFKYASINLRYAIEYFADAMHYVNSGLNNLSEAVSEFSDKFEDYTDDIGDELQRAKDSTSHSLDMLSAAVGNISNALRDMKDIIADFADEKPLEFVKLGDEFKASSEGLLNSLSGIASEIDGVKDAVSDEKGKITDNLTAVTNRVNVIMNLLTGEVEALKNNSSSLTDIFVDVSDEDIASARQGKIADCINNGVVEADRNTGGISGNIAIEYSKDPEDDIEKPDTLSFTYRTKAILQTCINNGNIKGKKDCIGGIAGKAEIGTIYECENYGDAESTNGNYIGGIVGKSDSSVRKCYAKGKLTGKRYVGGTAGKADAVTSCCTIVNVVGDESLGTICGEGNKNNMYNNYYIDNGLGALDGISYVDRCEAISFEKLTSISGVPAKFISFTVTFTADNEIVEVRNIKYGEETRSINFPKIPEKDGYFGKWQEISAETVTENITVECCYTPYITILSSEEKNESGKLALALAEGNFTDEAAIHITDGTAVPPVSKAENVKIYNISLTNTDFTADSTVTVRLLNENKSNVTIWQLKNGNWEKQKASKKGKYAVTQLTGTQNTVCIQYGERSFGIMWIIFPAAAIFAVAVIFIIKKRRKK